MLHTLALAVLASTVAAPAYSPVPVAAANPPVPTHPTTAMTGTVPKPAAADRHWDAKLPAWTHYLTVQQQAAAMRAELDAEFNVDHSP